MIGVIDDSGETHVLADSTGSFWSLMDSKWSLKQMNSSNEDNLLFELLGPRVVYLAVSLLVLTM